MKDSKKNKKIRNYSIIVIILLLVITISLSAAYLYAGLTLEDQEIIAEFEELNSLNFSKTKDLALNVTQLNAVDGAGNVSGEVTLTATYTGENVSKEKYNVYVNVLENDFVYTTDEEYAEVILRVYNSLNIEIKEIDGLTYVEQNGNNGFDITTFDGLIKIAEDYEIELTDGITEVVQDWKFEIEFVNLDTNQNVNSGKTLIAEVIGSVDDFDNLISDNNFTTPDICSSDNTFKNGTFQASIIENGGGVNCDEPDFNSLATTNEGIFATTDVYGPTYYFRGAAEDNWVKFAGFYWRIIRINGDGSVKIIYSGETAPTEEQKVIKTTDLQFASTGVFNALYDGPEYLGYTYTVGSLNNPSVKGSGDSLIKEEVDSWYETNIENQGYSSYVFDTAYCSDRTSYSNSAGTSINTSYTTSTQFFSYYVNLTTNKTPTLLCNEKKDYYTKEDTEVGNAALKYPVSLITSDEAAFAGGVMGSYNTSYYLYIGSWYWTISPYGYSSNKGYMGAVGSNGNLGSNEIHNTAGGIRMALSLNADILLLFTPFLHFLT